MESDELLQQEIERSEGEHHAGLMDRFSHDIGRTEGQDHAARIDIDFNVASCNTPGDSDCDGIVFAEDCDDGDATIGGVLYDNDFGIDTGWFYDPQALSDAPWVYNEGGLDSTNGGPQAVIGQSQSWTDVVVYAVVSAVGTADGCWGSGGTTNQWRAGITVRASSDGDQSEGFHGYRCALGSDTDGSGINPGVGPSTGQFVQIAEFMDSPEPDMSAGCEESIANSFTELARTSYTGPDITTGYAAFMKVYVMDDIINCQLITSSGIVYAQAQDDSFSSGTVGLSTLNMLGRFDHVRVCAINGP